MQLVHPDRQDPRLRWPESCAAQANRAYGILKNEASRAEFDREEAERARAALAQAALAQAAHGAARPSTAGGRWPDDGHDPRRRPQEALLPPWLTEGVGGFVPPSSGGGGVFDADRWRRAGRDRHRVGWPGGIADARPAAGQRARAVVARSVRAGDGANAGGDRRWWPRRRLRWRRRWRRGTPVATPAVELRIGVRRRRAGGAPEHAAQCRGDPMRRRQSPRWRTQSRAGRRHARAAAGGGRCAACAAHGRARHRRQCARGGIDGRARVAGRFAAPARLPR